MAWSKHSRIADHWRPFDGAGRVECALCPRHCKPRPGQNGFCGVRGNRNGQLHTLNYGQSVAATEEVIETEAVYHYRPGARILSLGNVGCMMACDFCQNWQTSQVKHLDPGVVKSYTSEELIDLCEAQGIGVISWTYNDPVVWHEFVRDTSRLARRRGIRTLYKSAFYIEEEPVRELIDCIDIFSLSLKSMSETLYRKTTKASLAPILERIPLVHRSGRHLEISQLVIPEWNDGEKDIHDTVRWVLDTLGSDVPLHFVGFHPAYKRIHGERTPVETLIRAREVAKAAGIKHCYLGNVYRDGVSDTHCGSCGTPQVVRYGLTASVVGLAADSTCTGCGQASPVRDPFGGQAPTEVSGPVAITGSRRKWFRWTSEINSIHLVHEGDPIEVTLHHQGTQKARRIRLGGTLSRVIESRAGEKDGGVLISWDSDREVQVFPVLDRAHFPVSDRIEESRLTRPVPRSADRMAV